MAALTGDRARHMARSSLLVMMAFVGSKAVGLLRERAIAHQFGASADYDAYVAAFRLPDLLFALIAGGALVSAFLPVFSAALAGSDGEDAWGIASGVTNVVFLATLAAAGVCALVAPWLVATVLAPSFAPAAQALTVSLMRIILVSTLVFALSGIQMGMLNAFQRFVVPAIAPLVYNLGIVAGAVWLAPRFGIRGLAYGVVLGAWLHLLVKVPALLHCGFRWMPVLGLRSPGVRRVFWLMGPRVLALGTVQAVSIVNVRLATGLAIGSLSAFNYAWLLAQMPQTILGTAVGTVAFPTLAEHASRGEAAALRHTIVGTLRVLVVVTVPSAAALWVLAGPAIDAVLVTGAFGAQAAAMTALALRMFALGLVGQVTLELIARAFYAQQDTVRPLIAAAVAMIVNILAALALVRPLAQGGLALANSIAVSAEVLVLMVWLHRRLPGLGTGTVLDALWRSGAAALAMALAMRGTVWLTGRTLAVDRAGPVISGLAGLGLGCLIGAGTYWLVGRLLGLAELEYVAERILRRRGRFGAGA